MSPQSEILEGIAKKKFSALCAETVPPQTLLQVCATDDTYPRTLAPSGSHHIERLHRHRRRTGKKIYILVGQMNKILFNFHKLNFQTKTRLIMAYCTSLCGVEMWDLSQDSIESICTAWRKGIRRMWHLPNTTHSALIPGLSDTLPLL